MKFNELGRSMVEMLGVLAIIGVLSVGAISGYSKAMFKYKLNKQAEAFNLLFMNAFQLMPKINNTSSSTDALFLAQTMDKLGLLPGGISFNASNPKYLLDPFGNSMWVYAYPTVFGVGYSFTSNNNDKDICLNLFNMYKQHMDILYYISSDKFTADDKENAQIMGRFYGNKYCNSSDNCIKDMTLNDIDILCNNCANDATRCRLYAVWK